MKKYKLKSANQHFFGLILKRTGGIAFSFALIFSTGVWVLGVMHLTANRTNETSDGAFHRSEVLSAKETVNQQILNTPNGSKMFNCPANTPIKGTLESQGKLLYLEPHNPQYLYTRPDSCFSSIEQAESEGYQSHSKNLVTSNNDNNQLPEVQRGEVLGTIENTQATAQVESKNVVMESVGQNLDESNSNASKEDKKASDLPANLSFDQMLTRSNQTKIIVVSIADQTLKTLYQGKVESETKITSGRKNFETPVGQFLVINKAKNVRLKAPSPRFGNYDLKVQYWLGFGNGYGFHDAYWRSSFGGEDREYDGSHGCINMPLEAVKSLYDWTGIGTEVYII